MTDAELKQQTRSVREEFERISDRDVDGDAQITAMRSELKTQLNTLRAAQAKHDRVRDVKTSMPNDIADAEREIADLEARRAGVIAGCLIDSDTTDFAADAVLIEQLLGLKLRLERLRLASSVLDAQERITYRSVELAGNPCAALEDRINQRRDVLKLTEARRRHGLA